MDRAAFLTCARAFGDAQEDHPWMDDPDSTVFRHRGNKKWFALVMNIPQSRLGMAGEERIDVVNLKADPILIGSLRGEKGIYPAYHMNKNRWVSLALGGSAADEQIKWLLCMSHQLTESGTKRKRTTPEGSDAP